MLQVDFQKLLYQGKSGCLHSPSYIVTDRYSNKFCGPCFFREGFWDEIPTRTTVKALSDSGTPNLSPQFFGHLFIVYGLTPPEPGESLKHFRRRRRKQSGPTKLFPFTSALWHLMGYQPPLARPLLDFCQGWNEFDIAERNAWSLDLVISTLGKASRTAMNNLKLQD